MQTVNTTAENLGAANVKAACEAAQEIETLAMVLRAGYSETDCPDLLVRGMTKRIEALAGVIISAVNGSADVDELLREIGCELQENEVAA